MLGTEILRLLREKWKSPVELAEELYVILSSPDINISTSAPIDMTKGKGTQPAMTLTGYSSGDPVITINRGTDPPIEISLGDLENLSGGGGTTADKQQQPNVFLGTVISGGPGVLYKVKLSNGSIVPVRQGKIDPSETIPVGTVAVVFTTGSGFFMQVPVFLGV